MDEGTERAGAEAVGDDVWRFATRDLPPDQRCAAWGEAMRRLRLPEVSPHGPGPVDGTITVAVSPMGLQFARIAADGQTIAGQSSDVGEGLWIGVLIEGQGLLQGEGVDTGVRPGMILCGITRNPARLVLDGRHVMLFVNVPRFVIAPRLLAQNQSPLLVIPGEGYWRRSRMDCWQARRGHSKRPFLISFRPVLVRSIPRSSNFSPR
jgi:hypothetical protein